MALELLKESLDQDQVQSLLEEGMQSLNPQIIEKNLPANSEAPMDISEELLRMQLQMEISRRFYSILQADLLTRSIQGTKIPDII